MPDGVAVRGELRRLVEEWDEERLAMAVCLQTMCEAVEAGEPSGGMTLHVARLATLAGHRFAKEEALMRRHRFSGLRDHLARHDAFRTLLGDLLRRCSEGRDVTALVERVRALLPELLRDDEHLRAFLESSPAGRAFTNP